MKLPEMKYRDHIQKSKQLKFGGLDHNIGAKDGGLWDMQNLCSDSYPLLAPRRQRKRVGHLNAPGGIFAYDKLCWVDGTNFYYGGEAVGNVSEGQKVFCAVGAYIVIFPDKKCYNTVTGVFESMEAEVTAKSMTFCDGTIYGDAALANTICCAGVNWAEYFKPGDGVTIAGCTKNTANNQTIVIHEIDGDKLRFSENSFSIAEGAEYTETGSLSVSRDVPDLEWVCENENRLWGCKGGTVYCCKALGDIFNWNVLDGLDSDAWTVGSGSVGSFCGAVTYIGYPTFMKETGIYKAYGSLPSNFQLLSSASLGLEKGSGRSFAVAGETLFYLNRTGVMAYTGGIPQPVCKAFGDLRFKNAVAGSDGLKYFVSMEDDAGRWRLFVYDTQRGLWHIEDDVQALGFALLEGRLYMLTAEGDIWLVSGSGEGEVAELEEAVEWWAEFGDFTEEDPNRKGISKLQIRLELEEGANAQVWIQYDSDGKWQKVGPQMGQSVKRSYYLPVVPRRCDHYRIKISGTGACKIHSLVRELYSGSEL